jgi:hypothetical protein
LTSNKESRLKRGISPFIRRGEGVTHSCSNGERERPLK